MPESLSLKLSLDQTSLLPDQVNRCHLLIDLVASPMDLEGDRAPMTIMFALDRSSSMKGPPIEHMAQSVDRMVELLDERDRIGIVTFATTAGVDLPIASATAETKARVRTLVRGLKPGKETHMEAGLQLGAELLLAESPDRRRALFLLSDGVPNVGRRCTPMTLAEMVRPWRGEIAIWSLGYGPHHQEDILGAISDAAGGRYQFIPEPEVCEYMFAKAVGVQGEIVAEAVELNLVPAPGVKLIRFLGKQDVRGSDSGCVLLLPDFVAEMRRLIVAEIELTPSAERGLWNAVAAELSYRPPGKASKSLRQFTPVMVATTSSQMVPEASVGVLLARSDQARADARSLADRGRFEEAKAVLETHRRLLLEWPGVTPDDGSPVAVAAEILREESMALDGGPGADTYRAYKRVHFDTSVSSQSLSSSWRTSENSYVDHVVRVVAGEYPPARLEQLLGEEAGRIVPLRAEQTLGRGNDADVQVRSERVSRAHAAIFAQRGRFFVIDLGSANGTWVNRRRVQTKELVHDDVIGLASDVSFRFLERVDESRLVVIGPSKEPYVIEPERLFVIGKSSACSMVIDAPGVARRHAAVRMETGRYLLEVYAGAPPAERRGRTFERLEIEDGDEVQLGDATLRFELR